MNQTKQMSESIRMGIVLALAGGFMDAYSYICRGEVFANAQTGNMLLMGVHLSQGEFGQALRYVCPVLAFAAGIAASVLVRLRWNITSVHWRQAVVLAEAMVLIGVSFLSQRYNLLANSLTSLSCGIQVQSFRSIRGNGIATTMCIGNLRSGTQYWCEFLEKRDRLLAEKGCLYYGIILCFILGAVLGNLCVKTFAEMAIRLDAGFLLLAFLMMFISGEKED